MKIPNWLKPKGDPYLGLIEMNMELIERCGDLIKEDREAIHRTVELVSVLSKNITELDQVLTYLVEIENKRSGGLDGEEWKG